jgi:hypothetical protein
VSIYRFMDTITAPTVARNLQRQASTVQAALGGGVRRSEAESQRSAKMMSSAQTASWRST